METNIQKWPLEKVELQANLDLQRLWDGQEWDSVFQISASLIKHFKHIFTVIFFVISSSFAFGNNEESLFIDYCNSGEFFKARVIINNLRESALTTQLSNYLNVVELGNFENIDITKSPQTFQNASADVFDHINRALKFYLKDGNEIRAHQLLRNALDISEANNLNAHYYLCSKYLLEIYSRTLFTIEDISYKYIIKNYLEKAASRPDQLRLAHYYDYKITMRYFYEDSVESLHYKYDFVNKLFKNDTLNFQKAKLLLTNSGYHNRITQNLDSSLFYIDAASKLLESNPGYFQEEKQIALEVNLASILFKQQKHNESLQILDSITFNNNDHLFNTIN